MDLASQNYGANTSVVSWSLVASGTWGSFGNYATSWSINIGGNTASGSIGSFNPNPNQTIASGQTAIGHDGNGYASIGVSGYWDSRHSNIGAGNPGGTFTLPRIPKAPAQNGAPVASNLMPTSVKLTWPANTNNNGAGIDQYLLRVHTISPADSAGYKDYLVGTALTHTVTGLKPGTQYYALVYAHNSQGFSPKSAQTAFKTLSGAYVRRGSTWVPVEVLVYRSGQWQSAEVLIYRSGAWVPAT
ncbi:MULTISPECIES: fibronectin type III domain-containing protein [unclassified Microbacterium]|uniref:fibronectin type III domain-containing protein n=1 Tax=unclassified Microbacterium TaxID=2609290 RepID=UPI0010F80260|nr:MULTISPECIES: fibronectin type III domain-containing protein [unclassified Microbacterium]